ncbi:hypothetical protein Ddc_11176 [Ditylenchus destructor]|nr:hypothetical protein Ddc_11176 [Ditylenchus destructor]
MASHLPLLAAIQSAVTLICRCVTFYAISRLFCYIRQNSGQKLAGTLKVYLIAHWAYVIVSTPMLIFLIVCYTISPLAPKYPLYTTFFLGIFHTVPFIPLQITVIFMAVDRCLAVRFLLKHDKMQKPLIMLEIFLLISTFSIILMFTLLELPLNQSLENKCTSTTCLSVKYRGYQYTIPKLSLAALSVAVDCLFLFFIGRVDYKKKMNRVIRYTVILDFLLNVLPIFSSLTYTLFTDQSITTYAGEYSTMCNALESAVLCVYFCIVFTNGGIYKSAVIQMRLRRLTKILRVFKH